MIYHSIHLAEGFTYKRFTEMGQASGPITKIDDKGPDFRKFRLWIETGIIAYVNERYVVFSVPVEPQK